MAINKKWHLYIYKSIAIYLHTKATADSLPLLVEMMDKRGSTWEAGATKLEATVSGPWVDQRAKGCYVLTVNVSVVATTIRGTNYTNHVAATGKVANWLDTCIECKSYGELIPATIGFLQLDDQIRVTHLKPKQDDDQLHSVIEARYSGIFEEGT